MQTMKPDVHENFLTEGCDPTCHICKEKIHIGEWYEMRQPWPPEHVHEHTVSVEIMVCIRCKDKPLPENEVERIRQYLNMADERLRPETKMELKEREKQKRVKAEISRRQELGLRMGCIVIGGRIIPGMAS